jgi:hypothetical protein
LKQQNLMPSFLRYCREGRHKLQTTKTLLMANIVFKPLPPLPLG